MDRCSTYNHHVHRRRRRSAKRVQRMTRDPETGWAHVLQFRKQTIKTQCVDPDETIKILNGI